MILLDRLLDHDRWATQTLLDRCCDLTDEQLDHEFDIGRRTVRDTFHHIIFNIDYWMTAMRGEPRPVPPSGLAIAALANYHQTAYAKIAAQARELWETGRWDDTFTDHHQAPQTYGAAITQFILHNTDHRTEIVHMLARLGQGEIEVDYGIWDFVRRGFFS